ncbi:MAG: DUF3387 domain-containing protein, partial [Chloroflexota bacterium]|nr:DUF3387 domain-containing protein [Chloroflexota bacterium]
KESPEVKEQLRRRYANKETVAGAKRRIKMIALDIADHFKTHVRSNGFKAQVVAPNRLAAVRFAEWLNSFGVNAYPIITTNAGDGPEFAAARDLDQDQVESAFVDPEGEPEVLVVVDMLLTGFDAPVEQVLYLDRSLRDHGLLQAIARVNRRFSHRWKGVVTEKTYGLVVDYHGVSTNLEAALQTFDQTDVQEAMRALEEDPGPVIEAAAVRAEAHFKGLDIDDMWACVSLFEADDYTEGNFKADLFEAFNADYRPFSGLLDRYLPDPRALTYTDRLARLTQIRAYVRAQYLREDADVDWTEIGAKVKQLVDERISAEVRELMRPVSILDEDFEQKIAALPRDEARASVMEHALRAQIHERLRANPAFYQKLSQQLERIIEDLRNRLIDSAEAIRLMAELRQRERGEGDQAAKHGLSEVAYAIYGLLDNLADEVAKRLSRRIEETAQRATSVVDWRANDEVKRVMRRDIKRLIRPASDYTEQQIDEKAVQMVGLLEARSGQ